MFLKCFLKNPAFISDGEIRRRRFVEQIEMHAARIPQACFPCLTSISDGDAGLHPSSRLAQKARVVLLLFAEFLVNLPGTNSGLAITPQGCVHGIELANQ